MVKNVWKYFDLSSVVAVKVADLLKIGDSRRSEIFETCERGQISFILFTLRNYLLFNELEQRNIYSYYKKWKQLSENNSRTPGADVISAILQHRTTVARLQKRLNSRTQTYLGFYCDTIIKCCNTE